jgi:GNAT superfamily N-acetyltransferase
MFPDKTDVGKKNSPISLRFAKESDTRLILEFIRGLAEYERLTHEVIADEDSLRKTLFNGRQVAEVILADYEDQPAGFSLFFHNYSTFLARPGIYIEDLFVKPDLRGKGVGKELLSFVAKIALERGCGRLEWSALDWNEPAIRFYRHLGAKTLDEWTIFRVNGTELYRLANNHSG